jgi:hypothetical protein
MFLSRNAVYIYHQIKIYAYGLLVPVFTQTHCGSGDPYSDHFLLEQIPSSLRR